MRPAFSVIFFSVLTGAGYGLLACAAISALLGHYCSASVCAQALLPPTAQPAFLGAVVLLAMALIVAGLAASVLHLGRPERMWRAFSQWRSSWLSREGVSASLSLVAATAFAALLWLGQLGLATRIAAAASVLLASTTVFCTARIYTSLPPIPAWRGALVLPVYFLFAATTGLGVWLALTRILIGSVPTFLLVSLGVFALATAATKWRYWRDIDGLAMPGTAHMTGLDRIGDARSFEAPHTEANYLTREMGFRFARRHASFLRATVLLCLISVAAITMLSVLVPGFASTPLRAALPRPPIEMMYATVAAALLVLAALFALLAALVERWLFFAEARHMVMAYYQR